MRTVNNTTYESLASKIARFSWSAGEGTDESTEEMLQSTEGWRVVASMDEIQDIEELKKQIKTICKNANVASKPRDVVINKDVK